METIIKSLLTKSDTVTGIKEILVAARKKIPTLKRDELIAVIANAGFELTVLDNSLCVAGAKLT